MYSPSALTLDVLVCILPWTLLRNYFFCRGHAHHDRESELTRGKVPPRIGPLTLEAMVCDRCSALVQVPGGDAPGHGIE